MVDEGSFLRIREGPFTYLLAADRAVGIEHRDSGAFQAAGDEQPRVAWYLSGSDRIPVIRLASLLGTDSADWEYAVLLLDGRQPAGIAAEHVQVVPGSEKPTVQPFNPVGSVLPGGPVITGVCPYTDPECLVLDLPRLRRCLELSANN